MLVKGATGEIIRHFQSWFCYRIFHRVYTRFIGTLCWCSHMPLVVNWCHIFTHIFHGCFTGTGANMRSCHCQGSNPDARRSNRLVTNHDKAGNGCIILEIYYTYICLRVLNDLFTTQWGFVLLAKIAWGCNSKANPRSVLGWELPKSPGSWLILYMTINSNVAWNWIKSSIIWLLRLIQSASDNLCDFCLWRFFTP